MNNRLKTAVIGLGIGEQHAIIYSADSRCELLAICDINEEKLKVIGKNYPSCKLETDPLNILNNEAIDLVSIASYDRDHAEQVLSAIENKKNIFIEKPLCLHQSEFNEITSALSKFPTVQISSNFVLRTFPQFKVLKEKIASGVLGEIYHIEGDYNYGRLHKLTQGWRGEMPFYSVTHGGGIHLIDLMKWVTGDIISEVIAIGNQVSSFDSQFRYPDMVTALLKFKSGATGKVSSNFGSVTPHHHALRVFGTKGSFLHSFDKSIYYFSRDNDPNMNDSISRELPIKPSKSDKAEILQSFIEQIITGSRPLVTKHEVLNTMAVSLSIEHSLASKNWEKVDSF